MNDRAHVGIVGGGVAGVTAALALARSGVRVTLFERKESLVGGPPFCHLHAGGNLYREISDAQCEALLRQSVAFARLYPFAVDRRPTVIAVPKEDEGSPKALLPRLKRLQKYYETMVQKDPGDGVLGAPERYFELFDTQRLKRAAALPIGDTPPADADGWMAPPARHIAMDRIKLPLILVQEYGLNLFRLAAGVRRMLEATGRVDLRLRTEVKEVRREGEGFCLDFEGGSLRVDYLVNAAGFRTGMIDDMLGIEARRMVEFKAAYTSLWKDRESYWPEVIFHGRRGTPRGMGQFTPYCGGYVQLHGMSRAITLFEDGLVASGSSSYPRLPDRLLRRIEGGWPKEEIDRRTRRAIAHLAAFIPDFEAALPGGPPLFGAQQIPGDDPDLRVAEVAFPASRYARCEIVKVSSVTDMAVAILENLAKEGLCAPRNLHAWRSGMLPDESRIAEDAEAIALSRGYPAPMARRCVS